jgi:hypothetical protein
VNGGWRKSSSKPYKPITKPSNQNLVDVDYREPTNVHDPVVSPAHRDAVPDVAADIKEFW